jgi:hypothetical protein
MRVCVSGESLFYRGNLVGQPEGVFEELFKWD